MNRGRAPARGTRRGAAAAGQRTQAAAGESSAGPSSAAAAAPAASTAASGSATPAIRTASTRGAASTRATRGAGTGRFRPKNIRRDEAEREELARREEQKALEREADERKARGRSRFRSKRSRGDAMGRGGFGRITSGASGPFSSGVAGSSGGGSWFGGGGGGGNFGGGGGGFGRGFKSESKPGFAQADGSRFREARINADKLHVHTPEEELDSEDEAMMNVLSSRAPSVLPMGIYRREHKEEGVVVATTAELEAAENAQNTPAVTGEEESLWVDGDSGEPQPTADQAEEGGNWGTDSKPTIKKEPGDDSAGMDINITPAEEKKPAAEAAPAKAKKAATAQELEDKFAELDLALLRSELGTIEITEGEDGKESTPSNKDGRLYLFRFPPIMPPLKQVAQPKPANKVKPEPDEANVLESTPSANPVDLTLEDLVSSGLNNGADDPENKKGFMPSLLTQGGMIGQLKVRKSGRTTLDWGGLLLDMGSSPDPGFLTTAVIVEENDEKPRPGVVGGESFGMGKIMGRFGLAPFWDEEEDWEVDPEDLKIK